MSNKNQHTDFTNFRKYYTGKMSAKEKTVFEESLENDPFAKDAFEGFLIYEKDFDKISLIENTNMSFKEKAGLEKASTISLKPILAIAASVLVLFSAYFVIQNSVLNGSKENSVANNDIKAPVDEEQKMEPEATESILLDSVSENEEFELDESLVLEETVDDRIIEKNNTKIAKEKPKAKEQARPAINNENKKQIIPEDYYQNSNEDESLINNEVSDKKQVTEVKGNEVSHYNSLYYNDDNLKKEVGSNELSDFKSGIVAYNQSNYNKAIQKFESSLKNNQSINSSNYYIGMSNFNLNKHNKAISAFDKVIVSSSSFADDAMWYKSLSLINKGQKSKAKVLLQSIIDSNSSFKTAAQNKLNSL